MEKEQKYNLFKALFFNRREIEKLSNNEGATSSGIAMVIASVFFLYNPLFVFLRVGFYREDSIFLLLLLKLFSIFLVIQILIQIVTLNKTRIKGGYMRYFRTFSNSSTIILATIPLIYYFFLYFAMGGNSSIPLFLLFLLILVWLNALHFYSIIILNKLSTKNVLKLVSILFVLFLLVSWQVGLIHIHTESQFLDKTEYYVYLFKILSYFETGTYSCSDPTGDDIYQRGKVSYRDINGYMRQDVDKCKGSRNQDVIEYHCKKDESGGWIQSFERIRCENGCQDGACIP